MLSSLYAENQQAKTRDSLLHVYMEAASDTGKLDLLYQIALLDQNTPASLYYENKLLEEALAHKNIPYQSAAIYGHIVYYYHRLELKNAKQWLQRLERFAATNNYYKHYFKGKKMMIESYLTNNKIEMALEEANEMYATSKLLKSTDGMCEARLCQVNAYLKALRYQEAVTPLKEALQLVGKQTSIDIQIDLLAKAVLIYSYLNNNNEQIHYLRLLKNSIQKQKTQDQTNPESINTGLLLEIQFSLYYTRTQKATKAWEHLQIADQYLNSQSNLTNQLLYLKAYAEYYQLIQDYEQALHYLNKAIQLITPVAPAEAQIYGLQKADLLVTMGKPEQALPLYHRINKTRDSLYTAFSSAQLEQIQAIYNMDKLILQKEKRETMFRRICLFIVLTIIIALLFFNLHMYKGRKRLKKDEKEMQQLASLAEKANEIKSKFLSKVSYKIRIPLNNVVGFSELLSTDSELNENERSEYSNIIQNSSDELIQLVNDVLDLSRLEADMAKFQLDYYSVEEWFNDLQAMARNHKEHKVTLTSKITSQNLQIHTDIKRLTKVLLSMLIYPKNHTEFNDVSLTLFYEPEQNFILGRITNSPMALPNINIQKNSLRKKINKLFFERLGGTLQTEKGEADAIPTLIFTYPVVTERKTE